MSKPRKLPKGSEKTIVFNFFNFLYFFNFLNFPLTKTRRRPQATHPSITFQNMNG